MAERDCGFYDCRDHYGDENAWCLRCRGLLDNDRRGDADDILSLQALLAEHGYEVAGATLTDCVRVVLLDKAKTSELLAKYVSESVMKTIVTKSEVVRRSPSSWDIGRTDRPWCVGFDAEIKDWRILQPKDCTVSIYVHGEYADERVARADAAAWDAQMPEHITMPHIAEALQKFMTS